MAQMQLFIIRHGETEENRDKIIQGHLPGRLSELGKQQARDAGKKLLKYGPFDQIISSDLERAKQTAFLISKELPPCKIRHEKRLRERFYGSLQGQPFFRFKRLLVENKTGIHSLEIPDGERYADFENRVLDFFRRLTAGKSFQKTIVVTHAGVIRIILEKFCCAPWPDIGNGEGFRISWTDGMEMKVLKF
jgi:broad specificity phosphatase PhoE